MSRWIVVCMLAALICGNQSESQYDNDDTNDSLSLEIATDTDSYNSDTQFSTSRPRSRVIKRHQTPIRNKIKTIKPHHTNVRNQMADMYPENHIRHPAKSNHPISDLISKKDTVMNPSDSIETYQPPNKKSEKVGERRKKIKTTPKHKITRTFRFKKDQKYNREFNSASSDYENEAYRIPKRIPQLVTEVHKMKKEHENTEGIMNESELDASNDKFLSEMKRENANIKPNRVKKYNHNKRNHKHENNEDKHITKKERPNTVQPEKILSTFNKMNKQKFVETGIDPISKGNRPKTHHSIKQHNQHEKHRENHHVIKPGPVAHFSLKDIVRQNKGPNQHKVNQKPPESQMNSLELEDAMAKPNGLLKPYDGDLDLRDEFTLTVVDMDETPKNKKTVYKFRDEGNQLPAQVPAQVPAQEIIDNQNNALSPINSPAAEQGIEYSVPLIPVKNENNNKKTTLKPVQPISALPEVEIGVHDIKNENKQNVPEQKPKKEKDKTKSKEEVNDFSKAELHLTQSEESDDEFAYIGYVSDKDNRGKKIQDLLRDVSGKSNERKIARKSYLSCLGKKALKVCIKSCNSAYKNVCKRLKCSSKAKKDLKTQCKRSCRRVFKSGSKKSDSSANSDSGFGSSRSSDSSF